MKIVITGGAGFLGHRLADALVQRGRARGADGHEHPIERITLVDVAPPPFTDRVVHYVYGDITDARLLQTVIDSDTTAVFHLAAVVSAMAEVQFDLGMRINVDATRLVLEVCRGVGHRPRVVFTSSVAVFGGDLPKTVLDSTAVNPQSSYGAEKAIGELLVSEYTRRGIIDGRVLRLPTISIRPGRPNAAASSFASGIIREPVNGEESICPVHPDTRVWVMSPSTAVDCLIVGHDLLSERLGQNRVVNLPGISVTAGEMVASLERVAGPEVARRVRWEPDPAIERIVGSWPGAWDTTRARALGFPADESFEAIVRGYVEGMSTV